MKKKNFKLRAAEFKDCERILALIKAYPEELLPRSMSDIAQNIDRFIVCEINNRVVGTGSWQILPEIGMPRHPSIEIQSLAIERKYHKAGIGRALINEIIKRIKPLHPHQIIALTFSPVFFRKMGFREIPKQQLMHKIYMGCINCTKYNSPFTCPEVAMALTLI